MPTELSSLSSKQLKRAAGLQGRIEALQKRLAGILGNAPAAPPVAAKSAAAKPKRRRRKMSPEAKARISAAQTARWAKQRGSKSAGKG